MEDGAWQQEPVPSPVPEDIKFSYNGMCWWCGEKADSREHKYKKSDVVREFGKGPWLGSEALLRGVHRAERMHPVSGPNASSLKFQKSLCKACNNSRSQAFDYDYDKFAVYFKDNVELIKKKGIINLSNVYGERWGEGRVGALRYFVKHISCRLAEDGVRVPDSMISFLNGSPKEPSGLTVDLSLRADIQELEEHMRDVHGSEGGSLWLGDSQGSYSASRRQVEEMWSHFGFSSLRVSYYINFEKEGFFGNFRGRKVRIKSEYNIKPSSIAESCRTCNPGENFPS